MIVKNSGTPSIWSPTAKKHPFPVLALCWSESRNYGLYVVHIQKDGAMLLVGAW